MPNPSNLTAVDLNTRNDVRSYFNNFFIKDYSISQNADDALFSFFQQITDNDESAKALASAVIFTSLAQGIDPIQSLNEFTNLEPGTLNSYLCMFLNLNRMGSSLIGLSNQQITNKYVKRSIIA